MNNLQIYQKKFSPLRLIGYLAGYVVLSLWLNSIRATAPIALVWIMIAVQFILYASIFVYGYSRYNGPSNLEKLGWFITLVVAILGRVNNWEIVILPLFVIAMIILPKKKQSSQTVS